MRSSQRLRLTVAYDGTGFRGWQLQPAPHRTVQGELEAVVARLAGRPVRVHGSGRTDTGVHARGQVAHVDWPDDRPPGDLRWSMNAVLPDDVRVLEARPAPPGFHARSSSTGKEYRYFIWNAKAVPPELRHIRTWEPRRLDPQAMREAAVLLVGTRDFAAFSANPQREVSGTVRTLHRLEVRGRGPEVCLVAKGDGFLYKMVRSLAGFLLRVGRGERRPEDGPRILAGGVRTAEVPTAEARGLFLWKVLYGPSRRQA